jgi:hypothetical protein
LPDVEVMVMIRKGQFRNIDGDDLRAQAAFIAGPFQTAA